MSCLGVAVILCFGLLLIVGLIKFPGVVLVVATIGLLTWVLEKIR